MKYQIEKNFYGLRILGEEFTRNNRNKGKLIINNKKFELKSIISVNHFEHKKIRMVLSKNIYNKSCMFKNCEALTSLSQINIYNYIEDLESMENIIDTEDYTQSESDSYENSFEDFNNPTMYNNIRLISEISKEKEENLDFQMILLFNERLKKFENNYTTYKEMFYNCRSLKSLPDISLWNTNYIIDMSYMFYNCELS
jgi:surface protein